MAIFMCKQCHKPFDRSNTSVLCPQCHDTELKSYNIAYRVIEKEFHRTNFTHLSAKVGAPASRLKKAIQVRIGHMDFAETSEFRRGTCALCERVMINTESKEPFCLPCTMNISNAVNELIQSTHKAGYNDSLTHTPPLGGPTDKPKSVPGKCEHCKEDVPLVSIVCMSCYHKLKDEVDQYRHKYPDSQVPATNHAQCEGTPPALKPELNPKSESEAADPNKVKQSGEQDSRFSREELDSILNGDDSLGEDYDTLFEKNPVALESSQNEALRHFGFKRPKSKL